jgi:hypothetical protein
VAIAGAGLGAVSGAGLDCPGDCSGSYAGGTVVTLTASASVGSSQFAGWSGGGCSGTGPCTVTVDASQTVTATFSRVGLVFAPSPSSVGLSIVGSGSVFVYGNPAAVATCPGMCSTTLSPGDYTATPASGWQFSGWGGLCSGTQGCADLLISGIGSVTATFTPLPPASGVTPPPASVAATPPPGPPRIDKVTIKTTTATFRFAKPAAGVQLECALVRHVAGRHAKQKKPVYSNCGTTETYRHLHAGSYKLYVVSVSGTGTESSSVERAFEIR